MYRVGELGNHRFATRRSVVQTRIFKENGVLAAREKLATLRGETGGHPDWRTPQLVPQLTLPMKGGGTSCAPMGYTGKKTLLT